MALLPAVPAIVEKEDPPSNEYCHSTTNPGYAVEMKSESAGPNLCSQPGFGKVGLETTFPQGIA